MLESKRMSAPDQVAIIERYYQLQRQTLLSQLQDLDRRLLIDLTMLPEPKEHDTNLASRFQSLNSDLRRPITLNSVAATESCSMSVSRRLAMLSKCEEPRSICAISEPHSAEEEEKA
jgi:hypothetical protein